VPLLTGANVLYVDDQPDARELVDAILTYHGATVVSVGTAQEALCVVRESAPHLLISDIGLPDEDGYALIRSVRALGPARGGNVPAIALTAYVRPEDGRRAKEEGFQAHLAKPVEEDELVRLVASLLAISGGRRDVGVGVSDRTMWR
jgi:CheY-like chemotaxis protein